MIDHSKSAFPKPAKVPKVKPSTSYWNMAGELQRIVLNPPEWKKLRVFVWDAYVMIFGKVECHICERPILDFSDYELDHLIPRGNGGCYRDDRKVKPSHMICNRTRGSKRL